MKPHKMFGYSVLDTSENNVVKYKSKYKNLSHVRTGVDYDGLLLIDGEKDTVVAFLQCNIKTGYITALEVNPKYRSKGIAKRLLKVATQTYSSNYLTVRKTNTPAISLYESQGWKTFKEEGIMLYMKHKEENKPKYLQW